MLTTIGNFKIVVKAKTHQVHGEGRQSVSQYCSTLIELIWLRESSSHLICSFELIELTSFLYSHHHADSEKALITYNSSILNQASRMGILLPVSPHVRDEATDPWWDVNSPQ